MGFVPPVLGPGAWVVPASPDARAFVDRLDDEARARGREYDADVRRALAHGEDGTGRELWEQQPVDVVVARYAASQERVDRQRQDPTGLLADVSVLEVILAAGGFVVILAAVLVLA